MSCGNPTVMPLPAPKPPQRTVSFLEQQRLPQKISAQYKQPPQGFPQPFHARTVSCTEHNRSLSTEHSRCHSSPGPLSPPSNFKTTPPPTSSPPLGLIPPPLSPLNHVVIDIEGEVDPPLPPPPYISPPPQRASPPLPPPPPANNNSMPPPPLPPSNNDRRHHTQCDSSSSTSSIDSGFRSSVGQGSEAKQSTSSAASPIYEPRLVFEPRSLLHQSKHDLDLHLTPPSGTQIYGRVPCRNVSALNTSEEMTYR